MKGSHAGDIDVPYESTRALAASFHLNDTPARADALWAVCNSDSGPDALAAALRALLALCLSPQATCAVHAAPRALPALLAALSSPPTSRQAFESWLTLLALLRHALASPASAVATSNVFKLLVAVVPGVVAVLARWSPGAPAGECPSTLGEVHPLPCPGMELCARVCFMHPQAITVCNNMNL